MTLQHASNAEQHRQSAQGGQVPAPPAGPLPCAGVRHEHPAPPVPAPVVDAARVAAMPLLDHAGLDWGRVERTAYLIHHTLRYEYPEPIADLRHRLVVLPPPAVGDQRRVTHRLEVTGADARVAETTDRFGNLVVHVQADHVEAAVTFEAWAVAERCAGCAPPGLPARRAEALGLAAPSVLTVPDDALRDAAAELVAGGPGGLDLAERVAAWTHGRFVYGFGATTVATTAAEALAGGRGVCQDYAHVMLAVCRGAGLAARYVSGHLLGEGGTHAWVEVLVPDAGRGGWLTAVGFDPTNDRRAGLGHVTVATGRDYGDVAPTSGTYTAAVAGRLSARKRVGLTSVAYSAGGGGLGL